MLECNFVNYFLSGFRTVLREVGGGGGGWLGLDSVTGETSWVTGKNEPRDWRAFFLNSGYRAAAEPCYET